MLEGRLSTGLSKMAVGEKRRWVSDGGRLSTDWSNVSSNIR